MSEQRILKWKVSPFSVDLNESKLNVREEIDKLFEIIPKLSIQPDLDQDENLTDGIIPDRASRVVTLSDGNGNLIGIGMDKQFVILSSDFQTIEKCMEFEATIDFVLWKRSIIVIGLSSSKILLIDPNTYEIQDERSFYAKPLDKERFFVDAFIHTNPDPTKIDMTVFGSDGIMYKFMNVSLSAGSLESTYDNSVSFDIDITTIKGSAYRIFQNAALPMVFAVTPAPGRFISGDSSGALSITLITGDSCPKKFMVTSNLSHTLKSWTKGATIKKVTPFDRFLIVLLSNGALEILSIDTLVPLNWFHLPSSRYIVHDFILVTSALETYKLWTVYSDPVESDHFISIGGLPLFESEFTVRIPTDTEAEFEPSFQFLTGYSIAEEPSSLVEITGYGSIVRVFKMEEFSTDISLEKLLRKGKFDKAEMLASRYAKDLDYVRKARLLSKYTEAKDMLHLEARKELQEEINNLLEAIEDAEFICKFVTENSFPNLDWTQELCEIALKRAGECPGSKSAQKLLTTVKKLYTFQQVIPPQEVSTQRWNEFNASATIFHQCMEFLQHMQFSQCEVIWLRHSDEFLGEISLTDFAPFFKSIFSVRLDTEESLSFFKTILPCAVEKCEIVNGEPVSKNRHIGALLGLVNLQIRTLERESLWPEEGLKFVKTLKDAVREEAEKLKITSASGDAIEDPRIFLDLEIYTEILRRIKNLIQALQELHQLKHSHALKIPFDQYISDCKMDVINSMLNLLFHEDEVCLYVKNFLIAFCKRNSLNLDDILKKHIDVVSEEVIYFVVTGVIPFEERLVTLVNFISSLKVKLECLHSMSKEWPVPWSSLMEETVKKAINTNPGTDLEIVELQNIIQLIYAQVPFRCLIQKYGLTSSKLHLSYNVDQTIIRILRSGRSNAYEDCLELVKHTGKRDEIGIRRLQFWMDAFNTGKDIDLIVQNIAGQEADQYLEGILGVMSQGPDLENQSVMHWERLSEIGRILALRLDDRASLQFFELRKLLPNLWDDDIISPVNYPFTALQMILDQDYEESSTVLIERCHTLARISLAHIKDILVTAASYFCEGAIIGQLPKIWDFMSEIVNLPGRFHQKNEIVPYAGLTLAYHLSLTLTISTTEQLETLIEFIELLILSYEETVSEPCAKLLNILSVFLQLRDKEIPLEVEFLNIYKEVWREGLRDISVVRAELETFGESLLRFGDKELHKMIFFAVEQEYLRQATNFNGSHRNELVERASIIEVLRKDQIDNIANYEVDEKNLRVVNLVKSLQANGLTLNSYSLRQRNKGRLIKKLIDMNLYQLGATTALVFDFRDGPSWSLILREYISHGNVPELKLLLENLKKMSELWVLNEFKEAWVKVSERIPNFRHMCPIPLGK